MHFRNSLCADTILSAHLPAGQGKRMVRVAAFSSMPVSASLFCFMEMRGQTLYFLWVVTGYLLIFLFFNEANINTRQKLKQLFAPVFDGYL